MTNSKVSNYIYTVFTHPNGCSKEHEERLKTFLKKHKTTNTLLILEFGSKGNNRHLNLITKWVKPYRMNTMNAMLKRAVYNDTEDIKTTKYLVKSQPIIDDIQLIGEYLSKEVNREVIINEGYCFKEITNKYEEKLKLLNKLQIPRTKYISQRDLPYLLDQVLPKNIDNIEKAVIETMDYLIKNRYAIQSIRFDHYKRQEVVKTVELLREDLPLVGSKYISEIERLLHV